MIKKDDIVNIYIDPYTRNICEGKVIIVKSLNFNRYKVKFIRVYSSDQQMFNYDYEGEILERTIIE